MDHYVGFDVSLEHSIVYVVDLTERCGAEQANDLEALERISADQNRIVIGSRSARRD